MGVMVATADHAWLPGEAVPIDVEGERWTKQIDPRTGWIRIAKPGVPTGDEFVEFAPESIAELSDGLLIALWLHPNPTPSIRGTASGTSPRI